METISTKNRSIGTTSIAVLIILTLTIERTFGECPNLCECKWKSGKESVLCLNANLSGIPTKLDAGTQVLDLRQNDISIIGNDAFSRANLLNLQKLYFARCRLKMIERYAFRKLINLVELDLSYNMFTSIPTTAFESTPELRELRLVGNPIQRIASESFIKVPQLIRLELSNCRISVVEMRAFAGLETSLEWLKLDGNKMMDIRAGTLLPLQNLHGLEMAGNPWNCSCGLRPLREWMLHENIPYDVPPTCRYPLRLVSKSWDKIDLDEFACIPHILAPDVRAHGVEGRNVTMSCMVGGVPEPSVRWMIRNRVIVNLTGNTMQPTAQGRKMYVAQLQQNASNLTILTAEVQDAGTYICSAENKAGKVEASVTLAVSRKPTESVLSMKVVLFSIVTVALFILTTSLGVVCVCTMQRRKKIARWNTQGRSDSYEKIELNMKTNHRVGDGSNSKIPRTIDRNTYMKSHIDNGVAVVGSHRRNGQYRNVPSEDDGTGYEDNLESSNATISNIKIENVFSWNEAAPSRSPPKNTNNSKWNLKQNTEAISAKFDETDLHIPRLIELSDSTPDSAANEPPSQYDIPKRTATSSSAASNSKSTRTHHINRKRTPNSAETTFSISELRNSGSYERRTSESDCNSDKKYPDLLDISSLNSISNRNSRLSSTANNAYCTIPRKRHALSRYYKPVSSDSQSPLLPESSSHYGSSTFGDTEVLSRRLSYDSFNNYPSYVPYIDNKANGRSNSFLNLVSQPNSLPTVNYHRRNPSLPSSPARDSSKMFSPPAETPLLDFTSLTSRKQLIATPSPSTSTSTSNAYDYHAAQLERFLEEYRNLQEQLCKMKETCDSIRKKEVPLSATAGNSAKLADPVMYTAAALPNTLPLTDAAVNAAANPKGILKTKALLPGQPPDPPPYWLHRNAMLKRLQDPGSDFFQS